MIWISVAECLCHRLPRMCSVCHSPNPVHLISSLNVYLHDGSHLWSKNYLPWWCTLVHLGLLPLISLYFSSHFCLMLWCPLRFSRQTMFSSSLLPLVFQGVHFVLYVSIYSYCCSTPIPYQITLKSNIVVCVCVCVCVCGIVEVKENMCSFC